ncbi:winged helix-turn-helix transcriptional regulator [Nocardioides sp.]|uniref:winged helix-turn-helix transcriptional regulator n=1 Tax=Nocardioides sp. TaxID=35761 RepID=UPI003D107B8A
MRALAELPGRPCPIAASLEVVGDRWSLLIVREISLGSTRFTDIVAGTGAPRDRVAARLRSLLEEGVVRRVAYQDSPTRYDYHLTEAGLALLPVLSSLLTWGKQYAVAADDPDRDRHRRVTPSRAEEPR